MKRVETGARFFSPRLFGKRVLFFSDKIQMSGVVITCGVCACHPLSMTNVWAQGSSHVGSSNLVQVLVGSSPPGFGCLLLGLPLVAPGRQAQYKQAVPWKLSRLTTALC